MTSTPEPTITIQLTHQQLMDIRVALLHRIEKLAGIPDQRCEDSRTRCIELLSSPEGLLHKALYDYHRQNFSISPIT